MSFGRIHTACLLTAAALAFPGVALAQSHPEFVPLGRATGALYKPDSGPAPHVVFLVSHRTANNLANNACRGLSERGMMVLCWNTRFQNNETDVHWEDIIFDVKAAVEFARAQPGITKVILLGHSGGSPLMSYYQAVAENGAAFCQDPDKLVKCDNNVAGFKPADGMVFPDAHPGAGAALRGINPSLSIVNDKVVVDPSLDPFDPKNGYNPDGASHYSPEFQKKYYAAQSAAMNAQIVKVQAMQAAIKAGAGRFPDDDIVLIPFAGENGSGDLINMEPDLSDRMATARPERLLKNDGTIVTQIVHSVKLPEPDEAKTNLTFNAGTKIQTTKSYLSSNATKSTNSLDGIDWCSTNYSTTCAIASIHVPTLIAAMGAFEFVRDQEVMYDRSPAKDKEYLVIEGAVHGYTPCKPCEKTPGEYSNSEKNLFDYIAKWTNARF